MPADKHTAVSYRWSVAIRMTSKGEQRRNELLHDLHQSSMYATYSAQVKVKAQGQGQGSTFTALAVTTNEQICLSATNKLLLLLEDHEDELPWTKHKQHLPDDSVTIS